MKQFTIIIVLLIALIYTGCEILDVEPKQSLPAGEVFTTPSGARQALLGCYDAMQSAGYYGRNFIITTELSSDNGLAEGTILEYKLFANNALLADNVVVEGMWNAIYTAINRANNVIRFTSGIEGLSQGDANDIIGQARFLRALHHFNLMQLFGGVPIRREPSLDAGDALHQPRASTKELFAFIEEDLLFAAGHIQNKNPLMATAVAASALLARLYLWQERWAEAADMASTVINTAGLSLENDFIALFGRGTTSESIFHLEFNPQDRNRLAEYFLPTSLGGRKEIGPAPALVNAFEPGDLRLNATLANATSDPYGIKYTDMATGTDKVFVIRLAEMYLIRAEARARDNGNTSLIAADIDTLRLRAGLTNTTATTLPQLLLAIEQERHVEFAFEGHRWFDLGRTNRGVNLISTVTQPCQMLFPIPLNEITTNNKISPADQNPCY